MISSPHDVVILRRKMPPSIFIVTITCAPILIFGIIDAAVIQRSWELTMTLGVCGLGLLINYLMDRSYGISADTERIYMSEWGFKSLIGILPRRSIAFDNIASMKGKFKGNSGVKRHFMPFELLVLKSSEKEDDIWIHPPSFYDTEIKSFLWNLHAKRPDIFSEDVIKYIRSDRPL